jgi:hypothetical protein
MVMTRMHKAVVLQLHGNKASPWIDGAFPLLPHRVLDVFKELTDAKNEAQQEVRTLKRELELKDMEFQHAAKQLEFEKERTAFAESKYAMAIESNKDLKAKLEKSNGDA